MGEIEPAPALERRIDLGKCQLQLRMRGARTGLPAVVLESGGGGFLCHHWATLEQTLALHTQVLSYERAGIGMSDACKGGAGADQCAEHLQKLLARAALPAPYVLAGYSLGGLYARYYAATRPQQIMALVLIDPTPVDLRLSGLTIAIMGSMAWITHLLYRCGMLDAYTRLRHKAPDDPRQAHVFRSATHVRSVLAELRALPQIQSQASAAPPLHLPVLCVSAGSAPGVAAEQLSTAHRHHRELAQQGTMPLSRHVLIEDATHASLIRNPDHATRLSHVILDFIASLPSV